MSRFTLPIDDDVKLIIMQSADSDYWGSEQDSSVVNDDREELVESDIRVTQSTSSEQRTAPASRTTKRQIVTVLILFLVNLLNYMDRFTIAGVLPQIKKYYGGLSNSQAGLLQTSFVIFYMVFSPIFGFLGDRVNRTVLMSCGILAWSAVTLAGSFVPEDMFWLFILMRGLVGIGEASYSTIAPTIIADLFCGDSRTKALTVFYFAIPVGSGFGYIVGAELATLFHHWQFALRFTPILGVICAFLIFFVIEEPERGGSEGVQLHNSMSCSSWLEDITYLLRNKSFMLATGGFVAVAFVAGALSFWAPTFMNFASEVYGNNDSLDSISLKFGIITVVAGVVGVLTGTQAARLLRPHFPNTDPLVCAFGLERIENTRLRALFTNISLKFGIITVVAGVVGVLTGTQAARLLRPHFPNTDPLVCAFGLLMCAPFLFFSLYLSSYNANATWALIFIGSTMLCLNWAVATDILLYVVVPNRRSTAEAFQILVGHTLGDAGSPYLVGVVSDAIKNSDDSHYMNYISLQYAMYMMSFVAVIGGGFYLATALFIVEDRKKADAVIKENLKKAIAEATTTTTQDGEDDITNLQDVKVLTSVVA